MAVTSAQWDRLIDLYLLGKLARDAWFTLPPEQRTTGCTFRELEEVKEVADEIMEGGVEADRIKNILVDSLPPILFKHAFPSL